MTTKQDTSTPKYLAYLLVGALLVVIGGLTFFAIPPENKELLVTVVQTLLTLAAAAVFYHVGSSSGSRSKDKPAMDPDAGPIHTTQTETTNVQTETRQELKP